MDDTVDLLQIKIDKAKRELPQKTLDAIAAVPWQAEILKMRETKGYTFEQLGVLEMETELVLCGLISAKDYASELERRMNISKAAANELVLIMNQEVFSKIKEELIKSTEKEKVSPAKEIPIKINAVKPEVKSVPQEIKKEDKELLSSHGIEIIPGQLELPGKVMPSFAEKLSTPTQTPVVKTEHTIGNITPAPKPEQKSYPPKGDPYRVIPE